MDSLLADNHVRKDGKEIPFRQYVNFSVLAFLIIFARLVSSFSRNLLDNSPLQTCPPVISTQ